MRGKCGLILTFLIVYGSAYSSLLFVNGQESQEMIELGRVQYQLLKERSNLPQHGTCWKSALSRIDEGCKQLSEETQSDLSLHITNCFLAMSGHETYNCEQDKKPNLRGICINNMSDRAFNVYTEFYTHTQNICWFLRGQTWHDTMSKSTLKVSKQLELSSAKQEQLIEAQIESITIQETMSNLTRNVMFMVMNVTFEITSCKGVADTIIRAVNNSRSSLEIVASRIKSIIFLSGMVGIIMCCTCIERTSNSRLKLLLLFALNFLIEIVLCNATYLCENTIIYFLYNNNYLLKCVCILTGLVTLIHDAYYYRDVRRASTDLIKDIDKQCKKIKSLLVELIDPTKPKTFDKIRFLNELNNIKTREKRKTIKNTVLHTIHDSVKKITRKGKTPNS